MGSREPVHGTRRDGDCFPGNGGRRCGHGLRLTRHDLAGRSLRQRSPTRGHAGPRCGAVTEVARPNAVVDSAAMAVATASRIVRAPRGTQLNTRGWQQEAALRMLMNNLDPEVAERPEDLVVYGGTGKAARNWECFDAIVRELR